MKIILFTLFPLLVVFSMSVHAQTDEGHLMTKGIITGNHYFSNIPIWTIIHDEQGTLVSSWEYGVAVARLDIKPDTNCSTQMNIVCFSGIVTSEKNYERINVGDQIDLIFELPDKQKIVIINENLGEFELNVDVSKLRALKTG